MQSREDQLADRDQSDADIQRNGVRSVEPGDSQVRCKKRHFEAEDCETVLWTFKMSVDTQPFSWRS